MGYTLPLQAAAGPTLVQRVGRRAGLAKTANH
jgi:hypothetical protein